MLFILDLANSTILSCFFFFFFLIIDLTFPILEVIEQIFNNVAKLVVPIRISTKEAKAEIEKESLTKKV